MQFDIRHVMYDTGDEEKLWAERQEEVFIGDSLKELEFNVENENGNRRGKLVEISGGVFPFVVELPNGSKQFFSLAYPIPVDTSKIMTADGTKPEMRKSSDIVFAAYKNREQILDYAGYGCRSINSLAVPFMWIKHKESENLLLITGYLNNGVFADSFYSFEELFEKFEYLDGTPCGVRQ